MNPGWFNTTSFTLERENSSSGGDGDYLYYDLNYNHFNGSELINNSEGLSNEHPPTSTSFIGKYIFALISGLTFVGVILNCGTIAVIFQPKKIKPVNYLIANLSVVLILMSALGLIYLGDKDNRRLHGVRLCGLLSLARNLGMAVISLTVMGISYERVRSLKPHVEQLLVSRTLVTIWTFSFIFVIPTYFSNVFRHDPPHLPVCEKVIQRKSQEIKFLEKIPPFGIVSMGVPYEVFRFTVFHVAVCSYMIFELYQVRSKMKYLYLFKVIPSEKMRRKIKKVRFVYFYSITFILLWLPLGMILSFYKSVRRQGQNSPRNSTNSYTGLLFATAIIGYVYLLITPVIILWTNEDLTRIKWFWSRGGRQTSLLTEQGSNGGETMEMSRAATFARTSDDTTVVGADVTRSKLVVVTVTFCEEVEQNFEDFENSELNPRLQKELVPTPTMPVLACGTVGGRIRPQTSPLEMPEDLSDFTALLQDYEDNP